MLMTSLIEKEEMLREQLKRSPRMIVAYSGGVDSAYLTYIAHNELRQDMMAVMAVSSSLSRREKERGVQFLADYSIPYRIINTDELSNPDYAKNDGSRCYHCKNTLFQSCEQIKEELGWAYIAYGFNKDDGDDFRPGQRAASQHRVLRPLFDAGMTKQDIRQRSQALGLKEPYRAAQPCLASRLMYGVSVTDQNLRTIELMEECLFGLGFQECRARYDGVTVRIEVPPEQIEKIAQKTIREKLTQTALSLGVKFVALDLEGFASGKLNRLLVPNKEIAP